MLGSSFRSLAAPVYLRRGRWKQPLALALAATATVAGCGGGGADEAGDGVAVSATRTLRGANFTFEAPAAWEVTRAARRISVAPAGDGATLLLVETFRLLKPYRPALFARAVRELDASQAALAAKLRARIERRSVVRVAGRRARRYELAYSRDGEALRQRATYVLVARTEYVLVCRWAAGRPAVAREPCARLLATFRLA
jgi:hypothetical protein